MPVETLQVEVYSEPDAARLLGVPPSTLHYWLQGGERRGVMHLPIIRAQPVDRRWVTWAEFIEAGWLSAYRKRQVPMRQLRDFIERLRNEYDVPYPLAHRQPLVSGKNLVATAQREAEVPRAWRLIDDQGMLTFEAQSFVDQVTWEGDLATGWRPTTNRRSTVRVRPDVRFGRPAVGGISTSSINEMSEDGATRKEIAEEFSLRLADVRWALAFEVAPEPAA